MKTLIPAVAKPPPTTSPPRASALVYYANCSAARAAGAAPLQRGRLATDPDLTATTMALPASPTVVTPAPVARILVSQISVVPAARPITPTAPQPGPPVQLPCTKATRATDPGSTVTMTALHANRPLGRTHPLAEPMPTLCFHPGSRTHDCPRSSSTRPPLKDHIRPKTSSMS